MKTASSLSSCPLFVLKAAGMDLKAWLGRERQTSGGEPRPPSDLGFDLNTVHSTDHLGDLGDFRDLRSRLDVQTCVCLCLCLLMASNISCAHCETVRCNCAAVGRECSHTVWIFADL